MAFTTMHFAVGMAAGGGIALLTCSALRRGWRYTPLAMTLGGIWAIVPDLPRLFTEDFPNLPLASILGSKSLEHWLDTQGNWFFLHRMLDEQPKEFALHGLLGILVLYNLAILGLLAGRRQRKGAEAAASPAARNPGNRASPTEHEDATDDAPDVIASIGPSTRTG